MTNRVVLLVTAEQGLAAHATTVLTGGGYVVLIARTLHDAVDAVIRLTPDVVLVGSQAAAELDGRDGHELLRRATQLGTSGFVLGAVLADATAAPSDAPWTRLGWDPADMDLSALLSTALSGRGSLSPVTRTGGTPETAPPQ